MKLFKLTFELHNGIEQKLVFADTPHQAIEAICGITTTDVIECELLCEAHQIIPATDKRLVFNLGKFDPSTHPIQQREFVAHLTLEMNRLNEEIEGIQQQKLRFLVSLCKSQGMIELMDKLEQLGMPFLISIKDSEWNRLSYLGGITRTERAHGGMFDGENNVRMFWDNPEHPVKAKFLSMKL